MNNRKNDMNRRRNSTQDKNQTQTPEQTGPGGGLPDRDAVAGEMIAIARRLGCRAQVTIIDSDSRNISLREGEVEQLVTSRSVSTGLRLFKDERCALIAFSGEDFDNLEGRMNIALENLRYLSPDPYKRLLTQGEFAGPVQDLDLADRHFDQLDIPQIKTTLQQIETAALAFGPTITPADMAEFYGTRRRINVFTTEGLSKSTDKTFYSFSYSAVARDLDKGLKERDYWSEKSRHFSQLPPLEEMGTIGRKAAELADRRLGGRKIKSGRRKVIFTWRTAASLLDLLCEALDGEEIVVKNSFLPDSLGKTLFPDHLTVVDDPLLPGHIGSYPFDGEGMGGRRKVIIDKGQIRSYLHNSYSAGKLGMDLTGNASFSISREPHIKVGNFYLEGGKGSLEDLVGEMKEGLVVDDLYVSGMNSVTGNFSFGCSGFLVEGGKMTVPVKEITIAGNLLEVYRNLLAAADDNRWKYSITSPSILVSEISVAGT